MNNNPLVNAREQIKGACEVLGYKEEVYESLKDPQRLLRFLFRFEWIMVR